jgi:hypothetical protein
MMRMRTSIAVAAALVGGASIAAAQQAPPARRPRGAQAAPQVERLVVYKSPT